MNEQPKQLSPQQQAVVDFVANDHRSAFVEAVAGAGKTTTLIAALDATCGSVAFAAYNRKIADEIKAKVGNRFGNRVRVSTFHSFGLNAWRYVHKNVKAGPEAAREKGDRIDAYLKLNDRTNPESTLAPFVRKLMSLAKQRALGLYGSLDDTREYYNIVEHFDLAYEIEDDALLPRGIELAIAGLKHSRDIAPDIVDFDDMIYMPVVSGIRLWQNDVAFVDEAQDTNPVRRAYVRKMLKRNGGRAIFVGDRHQAIYGFTGADNDAVDHIIRDFNCVRLPLTVTYRCPKAVVAEARQVVSHIEPHHTAPDGLVSTIGLAQMTPLRADQQTFDDPHVAFLPTDAILCRKTKPLVDMAFNLIRSGVACHVEGRDIGAGLIKLVDKFKSARSVDALLGRLTAYGERQAEKLMAKGRDSQAEALADRIATVVVIADNCSAVDEIRQRITSMFQDDDQQAKRTLTLSTVHKSKGREWPRVFILGRNVWMPGPWARQEWEQEQERNLIYVAVTRAQQELVYVNVPAEAQ